MPLFEGPILWARSAEDIRDEPAVALRQDTGSNFPQEFVSAKPYNGSSI
jgi:hypothetical protein